MSRKIIVKQYPGRNIDVSEKIIKKNGMRIIVKSYHYADVHSGAKGKTETPMSVPEIQEKYERDFCVMLEQHREASRRRSRRDGQAPNFGR